MLRVMPKKSPEPHDWSDPPKNWAEQQAHRVALEIRRLRDKRPVQWLAARTEELGSPVTRSVISDLELGRRRYVTTAELIVLARALDTAPIALLYPAPYRDRIQALPTPEGSELSEVEKILAVQWFSGEPDPMTGYLERLGLSYLDEMNYDSQLKALQRARRAFHLDARLRHKRAQLSTRRRAKRDGLDAVTNDELDDLTAEIDDLQERIDELWNLGGKDPNAERYEEMFENGR